jgi:hypothetical protein
MHSYEQALAGDYSSFPPQNENETNGMTIRIGSSRYVRHWCHFRKKSNQMISLQFTFPTGNSDQIDAEKTFDQPVRDSLANGLAVNFDPRFLS